VLFHGFGALAACYRTSYTHSITSAIPCLTPMQMVHSA